jgi:hypothetical protein
VIDGVRRKQLPMVLPIRRGSDRHRPSGVLRQMQSYRSMNTKLTVPILVVALVTLAATCLTRQSSARSMEALQSFALELLQKEHPDWTLKRADKNSIRIQVRGQIGHIYLDNILRAAGSDRTLAGKLIEQSAQQLSRYPIETS